MISRRTFVAFSGGSTVTLYAHAKRRKKVALASATVQALVPAVIPKYRTPLLIPPVMPKAGKLKRKSGKEVEYYEISVRQFSQQILPAGLPATTVWGYGAVKSAHSKGLLLHNAPSLTIEAQAGQAVAVKWINDLKTPAGAYLPHLLSVDRTLHWANPPGGTAGRDVRPQFTSTPSRYTGPVPLVTHVHGAVGVADHSDGYAEAWFLPAANNIPAGYADRGSWYDFFHAKSAAQFGNAWERGSATFHYPNSGRACADWYHDHTLGMTRLNVYAGPAGFFIVRGGPAGDDAVLDTRKGKKAELPGPAPKEGDPFPSDNCYFEVPIAIQDRAFKPNGGLYYPDSRALFDGVAGPYIPASDVSPIWVPEFFGNTIMVNGNTWPFMVVQQRRYRFRLLNGCQARFLILAFGTIPHVEVWQIGNEGGFLAAPVNLTTHHGNRLQMSPAERADLIVDFSRVPMGAHVLANIGPDEPFSGGLPGQDFAVADPATTGQVMQFRVIAAQSGDKSTPPEFLRLPAIEVLPPSTVKRRLALLEETSTTFAGAPTQTLLGTVTGDPGAGPARWTPRMWGDPVTENPAVGATETWELYNGTADAHPIHLHEAKFQVLGRQNLVVDEIARTFQLSPGTQRAPEPGETGFKDTVTAYPGEVTRLRVQFPQGGQFTWHCHIVEHEDNEMMRPLRVGPVQPGQPRSDTHR